MGVTVTLARDTVQTTVANCHIHSDNDHNAAWKRGLGSVSTSTAAQHRPSFLMVNDSQPSRRWTHFHSAIQLAIQRSAHKWT